MGKRYARGPRGRGQDHPDRRRRRASHLLLRRPNPSRWCTRRSACSGRRLTAPSVLVRAAFERAMEADLLESVLRINGKVDHADTAANPREDFAKTAEVFFGTNDVLFLLPS